MPQEQASLLKRILHTLRELEAGRRPAALQAAAAVFETCAQQPETAGACAVKLLECNRERKSIFVTQVALELAWADRLGVTRERCTTLANGLILQLEVFDYLDGIFVS
jgi:hypothetical protein